MTIYCPTCNRSSDDVRFIGEFCEFCAADRISAKIPNTVELQHCRICGRIRVGTEYFKETRKSLEEAIEGALKRRECKTKVRSFNEEEAIATFACEVGEEIVRFEKTMHIKFVNKTCLRCIRKSSGYYEGVVQFRGMPDKVGKFVRRLQIFAERKGSFIAKEEQTRNGWDCYIGEKTVANDFMAYYRLKPKISYTLYGMKNGKRLYRHIYSVHV